MWIKTTDGDWVNMEYVMAVLPSGNDGGAELADRNGERAGWISQEHWHLLDKIWTKELEWVRKDAEYVEENEPCG